MALIIYWFFTIGYMALIFYSSSVKGDALPDLSQGIDKIIHAGAYAILAFLFYISFRKSGVKKYIFLLSFAFAAICGISDEIHQFYVPGRYASSGDILANAIGAFLGSYIVNFVNSKERVRTTPIPS